MAVSLSDYINDQVKDMELELDLDLLTDLDDLQVVDSESKGPLVFLERPTVVKKTVGETKIDVIDLTLDYDDGPLIWSLNDISVDDGSYGGNSNTVVEEDVQKTTEAKTGHQVVEINPNGDSTIDEDEVICLGAKKRTEKLLDVTEPTLMAFVTPSEGYRIIQKKLLNKEIECVFTYATGICIGSYNLKRKEDVRRKFPLRITEYGILVELKMSGRLMELCVPITEIVNAKFAIEPKYACLKLRTGSNYAAWLRERIGMMEEKDELGNNKAYYDPLIGRNILEKCITIFTPPLMENDAALLNKILTESSIISVEKIRPGSLIEWDPIVYALATPPLF